LDREAIGQDVILAGWVARRRDHGGVIFADLRDRDGVTQVVFKPEVDAQVHAKAEAIRPEYVIAVRGVVEVRPEGMANPKLPTGEIEVLSHQLHVLNGARTPPFPIEDDIDVNEELRLRYRYIDLRRPKMQRNLRTRHAAYRATRACLDGEGFIEVETPFLIKSTPEGARDYLVPSRVQPGKFYALPQSPQQYKQLLMMGGLDRYYQIVKCFRDEDLRADRQPEFTQIDVEMAFVGDDDVMAMAEGVMAAIWRDVLGEAVVDSFPRLTYQEAMALYGTDKPDLRYGLEQTDLSEPLRESGFRVFRDALADGGVVKGIRVRGGGSLSRSQIDALVALSQRQGLGGLVWMRVEADGGMASPVARFLSEAELGAVRKGLGAKPGNLLLMAAGPAARVEPALGALRLHLVERLELVPEWAWAFCWVTAFPLLEYSTEEKRHVAVHHPFTAPLPEDVPLLASAPERARSQQYDLVLNGREIATGSIRIHDRALQKRIFELLDMPSDEAQERFGHLLEALEYGAPPHGGIAFGFDRIVALLCGETFIRDVIAFPKTNQAISLVDGAPTEVDATQLAELGLAVKTERLTERARA
jgi:aspartyl-tRNA synthetase